MKYNIMLTSLYRGQVTKKVRYYYSKNNDKNFYCDAILPAEASGKYILSTHNISRIIVLGDSSAYAEKDNLELSDLKGEAFSYGSDLNKLSTYSLMCYRLYQFINEFQIENQDIKNLLGKDEQNAVKIFLKSYFKKNFNADSSNRFNRFFDILSNNPHYGKNFLMTCRKNFLRWRMT